MWRPRIVLPTLVLVIAVVVGITFAAGAWSTPHVSRGPQLTVLYGDYAGPEPNDYVIFGNSKDLPLYAFKGDSANVSKCTGACATTWPPLTIPRGTTPLVSPGLQQSLIGTTTRPDGKVQVTYNGHPLYYYSGDTRNSDQANGQDLTSFGAKWYVIRLDGNLITSPIPPI